MMPTARFMLRFCLTGFAGLFLVGSFARQLEAATDVVPAPAPPNAQPMPMPAPLDPQDPMQKQPPVPGKPSAKPPSIVPPVTNTPPPKGSDPKSSDALGFADLNALFDRLRTAKTEEEAKVVNAMIEVAMLQSGSDTIDLLMFRALSAIQNQDTALAMDLLDSVIALKPDYAEGWNKRATLYFMKRDYGKAISDVEMVLRLQPRHYPALIGLAQMMNELGDTKRALEALKRVLLIYPLDSAVSKEVDELQSTLGGRDL